MWHASLAKWAKTNIVPINRWGEGITRDARRQLARALSGVGQGETVENVTKSRAILHHRRSLSDAEMQMLSAEWLAIPARDEFSPDAPVEINL